MIKPDNLTLNSYRLQADPLADQAVARVAEEQGPDATLRLFNTLIRNVRLPKDQLPDSLSDYLKATAQLPLEVSSEDTRLAQALFSDHGPKFLVFLYFYSLPLLYTDAKGARVLVHTGRLAHDEKKLEIFARRIAETGQFLLSVMTPGALMPNGPGIEMIQKIRLIHASIRHFIPADHWDEQALGKPINQEDLALTLLSFGVIMPKALEKVGIEESNEKTEAYIRYWNGIGRLLGIQEELLPANRSEAESLLELIMDRQAAPSEDGRLLTKALIEFSKQTLPETAHLFPPLMIRHFLGEEHAEMLGISPKPGCLGVALPTLLTKWFQSGEKLEDRLSEPLQAFIGPFAQLLMKGMVGYFDTYKQKNFELPGEFKSFLPPE